MIFEINPNYDEVIILDIDNNVPVYFALFALRRNITISDIDVLEDDCMIAYSNTSMDEIINHRCKLVNDGYHKATELYIRKVPNYTYKKPKPIKGKPNVQ